MGVNVLLFLVFQIGVEPWRRRRLVKGFEEKVREALEREGGGGMEGRRKSGEDDEGLALAASSGTDESVIANYEPAPDIPPAVAATAALDPGISAIEEPLSSTAAPKVSDPDPPPPPATTSPPPPPLASTLETYRSLLADLFSDRTITITQRDLTGVALQGAAAGMAVVGILVVWLRPK